MHLQAGPRPPHLRAIAVEQLFLHANRRDLTKLVELVELVEAVEAGAISTRIAETYPLQDAASAYKRLAKGGVRGRLVLIP